MHTVKIGYFASIAPVEIDDRLILVLACVPVVSVIASRFGGYVLERMSDKQFFWWTRRIVFCVGTLYVLTALRRTFLDYIAWHDARVAFAPRSELLQQRLAPFEPPAGLVGPRGEGALEGRRLQLGLGVQRPVGIVQRLAADGDEVGPPCATSLGLFRRRGSGRPPWSRCRPPRRMRSAKRHLEAGDARQTLAPRWRCRDAAGGAVDHVDAGRLQCAAKATVSSTVQPPSTSSIDETRTKSGLLPATRRGLPRRPRAESACGRRGCRRIRRCAGWRSATGTRAAGSRARRGSRRRRSRRAAARSRRRGERGAIAAMSAFVSARGASQPSPTGSALGATVCHGFSPRARSLASSGPLPCQGRCVLALRPACASWMPATAPWPCTNAGDAREAVDMCASFQMPGVAVGDAAVLGHRRRLDEHEAGAAEREAAEMDEMPVGGVAVDRRVLAHRRDDDAVLERQCAERERAEQGRWHGEASVANSKAADDAIRNG